MTSTHLRSLRAEKSIAGDEGFTLIELLVAIFLFGVVMVALTGTFIASAQSIADQRLRTAATRVPTDHLKTLRRLPFDQLDAQAAQKTVTTRRRENLHHRHRCRIHRCSNRRARPRTTGEADQATVSWTSETVTRQPPTAPGWHRPDPTRCRLPGHRHCDRGSAPAPVSRQGQ